MNLRIAGDWIEMIPLDWYDAELCIGDSWDHLKSIKRISFQTNSLGRRVIILHEKDFQ